MTVTSWPSVDRRRLIARALALGCMPMVAQAATPSSRRFPVRLRDMMVMDARTGTRSMLLRDLVRDRVAVLNFMFTGCSTVCPMQATLLAGAQRLLAKEMDRRVVFVSVSITPLTDTPAALVGFADAHSAGAGWYFTRGGLTETQRFQEGFDSLAARVEDHPPVISIGRVGAPGWTRLYGAPSPRLIAGEVRDWLIRA